MASLDLTATVTITRKCGSCDGSGRTGGVDGRCRQCGRMYFNEEGVGDNIPTSEQEVETFPGMLELPCGHDFKHYQCWDVTCEECNDCGEGTPGIVTEIVTLAELFAAFAEQAKS